MVELTLKADGLSVQVTATTPQAATFAARLAGELLASVGLEAPVAVPVAISAPVAAPALDAPKRKPGRPRKPAPPAESASGDVTRAAQCRAAILDLLKSGPKVHSELATKLPAHLLPTDADARTKAMQNALQILRREQRITRAGNSWVLAG